MPIFEYRCEECGSRFEKLVRRADAQPPVCPQCDSPKITRQLSVFAAHSGEPSSGDPPMCPSGGVCPTPGACGLT